MEGDEDFVFPPAERRVVTQPVDLSVSTLAEQWETGSLLLPAIQRGYVWDSHRQLRGHCSLTFARCMSGACFFPNDEAQPNAPRITSATELGHYRRPEATRLIALINRAIDAGLHHDQLGGRVDEDAVAVSTKKNKLAP